MKSYFVIVTLLILTQLRSTEQIDREWCSTRVCTLEANYIIRNKNDHGNPCLDFYDKWCAGYIRRHLVPDNKNLISTTKGAIDETYRSLRGLLETVDEHDSSTFQLLKTFYDSCLGLEEAGSVNEDYFKELMVRKYGGWPIMEGDNWNETNFDWTQLITQIAADGFDASYLFKITVEHSYVENSKYSIMLDGPSHEIPRDHLLRGIHNSVVVRYTNYLKIIARHLSGGNNHTAIDQQVDDVIAFAVEIATIPMPHVSRDSQDDLLHFININTLQLEYPQIKWMEFLQTYFQPFVNISQNDHVIVKAPQYLIDVLTILKHVPKRTLANYIYLRTISNLAPYLSHSTRQSRLYFSNYYNRETLPVFQENQCIETMNEHLPLLSGVYLNSNPRTQLTQVDVKPIFKKILNEFKKRINIFPWINVSNRKKALEKLNALSFKLIYPDEKYIRDDMNKNYEDLHINKNNYLASMSNISVLNRKSLYGRLRVATDNTNWMTEKILSTETVHYNPYKNCLEVPISVLHGFYYHPERPVYLNFGGIGVAMAREIVHSIDSIGKRYNSKGQLSFWWSTKNQNDYNDYSDCFIEAYGSFFSKQRNKRVNGVKTVVENIADYFGLKIAYSAYKSSVVTRTPLILPSMHFNSSDFFWIAYANTHCTIFKKGIPEYSFENDIYSPPDIRVNGPLSYMAEFAKDFNCPIHPIVNNFNGLYTFDACHLDVEMPQKSF